MKKDKHRKRASETTATNAVATDEQPASSGPTHDQIVQRAYELFLARGAIHGDDLEDWLRAERELRAPESHDDPDGG